MPLFQLLLSLNIFAKRIGLADRKKRYELNARQKESQQQRSFACFLASVGEIGTDKISKRSSEHAGKGRLHTQL